MFQLRDEKGVLKAEISDRGAAQLTLTGGGGWVDDKYVFTNDLYFDPHSHVRIYIWKGDYLKEKR